MYREGSAQSCGGFGEKRLTPLFPSYDEQLDIAPIDSSIRVYIARAFPRFPRNEERPNIRTIDAAIAVEIPDADGEEVRGRENAAAWVGHHAVVGTRIGNRLDLEGEGLSLIHI